MSGVKHVMVGADDDGVRLDRWLKKQGIPFRLVQKIIRTGQVRVDGKRAKADSRIHEGQDIRIPPVQDKDEKEKTVSAASADFIRSLVIYDDGDIVALNKPCGIASQGGTKSGWNIDRMLPALADEKGVAPRLVHRLDKDTSGVMLVARSGKAVRELGKMFKGRDIRKEYWAICVPPPEMNDGEIRAPIRKHIEGKKENMIVDPKEGQNALTLFEVVERAGKKAAFVAFWPRTGRTHQIRVHAAYMNAPVLGDTKYERRIADHNNNALEVPDLADRLHLHAAQITFRHPVNGKNCEIRAPLPDELKESWKAFGFQMRPPKPVFDQIELS